MTDATHLVAALRSTSESEVYGALIRIGKDDRRELEEAVVSFLDHASAHLRSAAIRVLGFYWGLPAYRQRAREMACVERDAAARSVAIMAWCSYYRGTKDADVLRQLLAWLTDHALSDHVRTSAYSGMMVVAGLSGPERARALPRGPIDDSIDWELVRTMLGDSGIDVPAAETSLAAKLGVRKVTYDYGEPNVPTSYVGRVVLTFDGETGLVELVQEIGDTLRAWQGILPAETWRNLLATLERCRFPKAPVISEPPVPGSLSATISWERHGQVESVLIAGRTTDYRDLNRFAWSVIAQMAPELIRGEPTDRIIPDTRIEQPYEMKGHIDRPT